MKQIHLFSFFCCVQICFLFSSCSSDSDKLNVFCTGKQVMMEGVIHSLHIESGTDNYTIESLDESVATLEQAVSELTGTVYYNIIPHSKGKAIFSVYDGKHQKTFEIDVVEPYMAFSPLNISVSFTTTGEVETPLTVDQLHGEALFTEQNTFILQKDKDNSFYLFESRDSHTNGEHYIAKGTYRFSKIDYKPAVEITVDGETHLFWTKGDRQSSIRIFYKFYMPEWLQTKAMDPNYYENVVLEQDITQKIIEKYPNAGISEASIRYQATFLEVGSFPAPVE